jgi:small subunit ribosomal protein S8
MVVTDPIADMLTRIRNAMARSHEKVDMPASRMKMEIVRVLKREGYIKDYRLAKEGNYTVLKILLKYAGNKKPVINTLRRVSRPGRRVYVGAVEIPRVLSGLGIAILSTPKGILTDNEARQAHVGGEVLCEIW